MTQNKIAEEHAVSILVQLMVNPPSQEIQVEVSCQRLQTVAHKPFTQHNVHICRWIAFLQTSSAINSWIAIGVAQVAYTLGCVVLNNSENQDKLHDEPGFKFDILLQLLATADEVNTATSSRCVMCGAGVKWCTLFGTYDIYALWTFLNGL